MASELSLEIQREWFERWLKDHPELNYGAVPPQRDGEGYAYGPTQIAWMSYRFAINAALLWESRQQPRYEYIRLELDWGDLEQLNRLSGDGWKAVGVYPSDSINWTLLERRLPDFAGAVRDEQ